MTQGTALPVEKPKVDPYTGLAIGRIVIYRYGAENEDHAALICKVFIGPDGKPNGKLNLSEFDSNGTIHSQYGVSHAGEKAEGAEWPPANTWRWPERV